MNTAITEGLQLMPPPFAAGLDVWSRGDGTPGSATYATGGGAFVPADQDFSGCLEVNKTSGTQKVRYMGETTILPGCYLEVTARVKAMSGALPAVRVAGWASGPGGSHLNGVTETGPSKQLTTYGEVVTITAIIGTGDRNGVDMVWTGAIYGHIGIDLTGPNGGVVRVDDIEIRDVTSYFLRDLLGLVDVRDYGAKGDGVSDDTAAFEAADSAAQGREVLVSAGTYRLTGDVTFQNQVRFEGTVVQPIGPHFILQRNFDYETYLDAFADEELAFKKAYQALINYSDHESLDLCGRRIALTGPLDMQALEPTKTSFKTRRVIRNGQFEPADSDVWNDTVVTSQATYSASNPTQLTGVANIAAIPVGSLVTGGGVGREVYVRNVNVGQQRLELSQPLYDAEGTQNYTFRRFQYMLDFSGYDELSQMILSEIDFLCRGQASAIMMAKTGIIFHVKDCFFNQPKSRGLTSIGRACQGLMIDRCQFISNEQDVPVEQRTTIGFNANANDVKIRDNRCTRFKQFAILAGTGSTIVGNHWFLGDDAANGVRVGGLVLTRPNVRSIITGNYIDNNIIEWTNEHDESPAFASQYSFGGLTITGNNFTASSVAPWFRFIRIKPYGPGHFVHGLSVISNVFRIVGGSCERVEEVDTTFADLDFGRMRNVTFYGNVFNAIDEEVRNPLTVVHDQASPSNQWIIDPRPNLPFGGRSRTVEAVAPVGEIETGTGQTNFDFPRIDPQHGATQELVRAIFSEPVRGQLRVTVRMDNPN
ncbi:glycosyl hydrolase family 28-related protein [Pseudoroseicyclus tamaricis]|uniref:Right-handed parallel beta-helix repeat-containing protein n=1 Tax=Pseudoroseicyclus tamaricis TaxID=2705421 RepID=A0A6B2JPG2_9RHOB|nr:glycosyl hydrolase family 28-related protein [Pseudoroseicyclus tamaricis]NDU99987.1 right-handed parallel beta-helix repeat-containing protein [Pseudoroseicyclus tamaricis]